MPAISRKLAVLVLAATFVLAKPVPRDDMTLLGCMMKNVNDMTPEKLAKLQNDATFSKDNPVLAAAWTKCCDDDNNNQRSGENASAALANVQANEANAGPGSVVNGNRKNHVNLGNGQSQVDATPSEDAEINASSDRKPKTALGVPHSQGDFANLEGPQNPAVQSPGRNNANEQANVNENTDRFNQLGSPNGPDRVNAAANPENVQGLDKLDFANLQGLNRVANGQNGGVGASEQGLNTPNANVKGNADRFNQVGSPNGSNRVNAALPSGGNPDNVQGLDFESPNRVANGQNGVGASAQGSNLNTPNANVKGNADRFNQVGSPNGSNRVNAALPSGGNPDNVQGLDFESPNRVANGQNGVGASAQGPNTPNGQANVNGNGLNQSVPPNGNRRLFSAISPNKTPASPNTGTIANEPQANANVNDAVSPNREQGTGNGGGALFLDELLRQVNNVGPGQVEADAKAPKCECK